MTQLHLKELGLSLPDRDRVIGKTSQKVKLVPTGELTSICRDDTFEIAGVDRSKNNLEGKKLVLFFGRYSHPLTRNFFAPKLAMIYKNMTETRDDVEFIFVSLDSSEQEYNTFTRNHRKSKKLIFDPTQPP